jgi:hypothetical protein
MSFFVLFCVKLFGNCFKIVLYLANNTKNMRKINDDLTLNYVEENFLRDEKLITVEIWFDFFGKSYVAYLRTASLESEQLDFASIEGPEILFESFEELIEEDEEVVAIIREEAKKYVEEWNENNKD